MTLEINASRHLPNQGGRVIQEKMIPFLSFSIISLFMAPRFLLVCTLGGCDLMPRGSNGLGQRPVLELSAGTAGVLRLHDAFGLEQLEGTGQP